MRGHEGGVRVEEAVRGEGVGRVGEARVGERGREGREGAERGGG